MRRLVFVVLTLILGISAPAFAGDTQTSRPHTAEEIKSLTGDVGRIARGEMLTPTNEMHGVSLIDTSNEAGATNIATSTLQPDGSILVTQSVTHGDGRTEAVSKSVSREEWAKLPGHGYTGDAGIVAPKTATMPDGSSVGLSVGAPKPEKPAVEKKVAVVNTPVIYEKPKTLVSYEYHEKDGQE